MTEMLLFENMYRAPLLFSSSFFAFTFVKKKKIDSFVAVLAYISCLEMSGPRNSGHKQDWHGRYYICRL